MKKISLLFLIVIVLISCKDKPETTVEMADTQTPFVWENASIYFMLTDRFNNGDTSNDLSFDRKDNAAKLRGFKGGDLKGIIAKIEEGYFNNLGVNAIWMTPIVEQIHGAVDEGPNDADGCATARRSDGSPTAVPQTENCLGGAPRLPGRSRHGLRPGDSPGPPVRRRRAGELMARP